MKVYREHVWSRPTSQIIRWATNRQPSERFRGGGYEAVRVLVTPPPVLVWERDIPETMIKPSLYFLSSEHIQPVKG